MAISLLIDTSGGSDFESFHLRNVASLHVGGSALATETLDVTGTVGISSVLKVDTIDEFTTATGVTIDGVVIKDSGATFGGDLVILNGFGIIVGHTALLAVGETTGELQVLGTADADSSIIIGRYSADVTPASIRFYKSRAAIGSLATVVTGDELGAIRAYGDDGTDAATRSSAIIFDTEGTISTGQVPGIIRIQVAAAGTLADAITINSAKAVAMLGAVTITGLSTFTSRLLVDDTTQATTTTDGSLQTDGGLSVVKNAVITTMTLATGSITDSSGAITFGDENLVTTGTLGSGALTATKGTFSDDLILTATTAAIRSNTSDGSDNKRIFLTGGGLENDPTRGAFVAVHGNETNTGDLWLSSGNASGSRVEFYPLGSLGGFFDVSGLTVSGDLVVSGTGPHVIGGSTLGWTKIRLGDNAFTSDGSSDEAVMVRIGGNLTGAGGDIALLAGTVFANAIITQTATETVAVVSQVRIIEPLITDNLTGDITVASTVHIVNAPTEGLSNYALWVDDGASRFDGDITCGDSITLDASVARIIVDGTDGFISAGSVGISEAGTNLFLSANQNVYVLIDNDNNGTTAGFTVIRDTTTSSGGTTLFDVQEDGTVVIGAGGLIVSDQVIINDTSNANMTVGLTINQGANDNQILSLKSTDIDHGMTTLPTHDVELDDFFTISKVDADAGGVHMQALCEDAAVTSVFILDVVGGTGDTSKDTTAIGLIDFIVAEHDDDNTYGVIAANTNLFTIARRNSSGTRQARLWLDEDGDLQITGEMTAPTGTFSGAVSISALTVTADAIFSDQVTIGGAIEVGSIFNIEPGVAARDILTSIGTGLHIEADTQAINAAGNGETVAIGSLAFLGIPTWTSVGTTFTISDAATLYIQGPPVGSTNVTHTREYALWVDAGLSRFDDIILSSDGAIGAPTYSFVSNTDTGIYLSGASQIGIVVDGAQVLRISANILDIVAGGTAGAPSLTFVGDADTGVFHPATNAVGLTAGGAEMLRAFSDVRIGNGSAIATTAVTGFLLIPGCAGTPTGDPTNDGVGAVALVYDTTNNLLYANDAGGWVAVNSP